MAISVSAVACRTPQPALVEAIDDVRAVAEEANMLSGIIA
jgi:hypothetical protein